MTKETSSNKTIRFLDYSVTLKVRIRDVVTLYAAIRTGRWGPVESIMRSLLEDERCRYVPAFVDGMEAAEAELDWKSNPYDGTADPGLREWWVHGFIYEYEQRKTKKERRKADAEWLKRTSAETSTVDEEIKASVEPDVFATQLVSEQEKYRDDAPTLGDTCIDNATRRRDWQKLADQHRCGTVQCWDLLTPSSISTRQKQNDVYLPVNKHMGSDRLSFPCGCVVPMDFDACWFDVKDLTCPVHDMGPPVLVKNNDCADVLNLDWPTSDSRKTYVTPVARGYGQYRRWYWLFTQSLPA